jgi:hypothetical protein
MKGVTSKLLITSKEVPMIFHTTGFSLPAAWAKFRTWHHRLSCAGFTWYDVKNLALI